MTIGPDAALYTILFILPGFLFSWVASSVYPRKPEDGQQSFIRFLALSCLIYMVLGPFLYLTLFRQMALRQQSLRDMMGEDPDRTVLVVYVAVFVAPVVGGVVSGRLCQARLWQRLLSSGVHPIGTAWDRKFYEAEGPMWVLVTLKDGSQVAGLYGDKGSFASSDAGQRDLYLEAVYDVVGDGPWQPAKREPGIWIRGDEIRHIEFWDNAKEDESEREEDR